MDWIISGHGQIDLLREFASRLFNVMTSSGMISNAATDFELNALISLSFGDNGNSRNMKIDESNKNRSRELLASAAVMTGSFHQSLGTTRLHVITRWCFQLTSRCMTKSHKEILPIFLWMGGI